MKNKVNLELKYFCKDFIPIRKILKNIGAKKIGIFNQKDYFFNLPFTESNIQPRFKLRIQNREQTLVYYKRPNFSQNKITSADVALLDVKDKNLLAVLQKTLGVKAIVIKKRELWRKDNCIFNLDTVKGN